ncbi:MAG: hypothetical protein U0Z44_18035 [Kouleothrix sp.]
MITEVSGVAMRLRAPGWPTWHSCGASSPRFFYRVPDDPAMLREGFLDYRGPRVHGTALASARSAADHAITRAAHAIPRRPRC